ncbi:MAG: caspase family protein, partial [Fibromonadaceae bacterium]|nr:caspase family protein [Fibromonadaceae bacterium]
MKKTIFAFLLVFAAFLSAAPQKIERFLLVAGANDGGKDRVKLRYAESDANSFASVLAQMGGVPQNNILRVFNPNAQAMQNGFAELEKRLKSKEPGTRKEVFVYYSGHADDKGLRLGSDIYSWAELRKSVSNINADVKVAVLDACGSGAITRTKGGVSKPAFLQDASSEMKGYAFLTSSSENEASQESDRLKGSFFTHALVSGLRGAADMTGNGKVTLSEAYQFAFNETLQSTQNTSAGSQHPNRDMNLAGTGDVVMTDLRETGAVLTLDADLEGRFFIRDAQGNLFAELHKIRGRQIELGMPAGKYSVQMEAPSKIWKANEVQIS